MANSNPGETPRNLPGRRLPEGLIAGGILIALGLVMLVAQIVNWSFMPMLVLPAFGLIFLVAGVMARQIGPLVAAGIFLGLSAGVITVNLDQVKQNLTEEQMGAVVVGGLALGFLLITVLVAVVVQKFAWWPLIPGGVLGLVAVALLAGPTGIKMLEWLSYVWPVALILTGVYLLYKRGNTGGTQHR